MNNAVHQLTKLILEAMAWVLNTAASLWVWSWTQIAALFGMAWGDLPGWKLAVGIAVLAVLAAILVIVAIRAWDALGRIAAAFWTMALTLFTLLAFVIAAGLFSRGFQWVVASVSLLRRVSCSLAKFLGCCIKPCGLQGLEARPHLQAIPPPRVIADYV
jgi:hypothetical protein